MITKKKLIQKLNQSFDLISNEKRGFIPFKNSLGHIYTTTKDIVLNDIREDILRLKISNDKKLIEFIMNKYKYMI